MSDGQKRGMVKDNRCCRTAVDVQSGRGTTAQHYTTMG